MSTAIDARRPGLSSWLTLIRCEAKMVIRDTAGLSSHRTADADPRDERLDGRRRGRGQRPHGLDVYVLPLVFTVVMATDRHRQHAELPGVLPTSGILRRLSVTPASPAMVLVAQAVVSVLQAVIGIGAALALAGSSSTATSRRASRDGARSRAARDGGAVRRRHGRRRCRADPELGRGDRAHRLLRLRRPRRPVRWPWRSAGPPGEGGRTAAVRCHRRGPVGRLGRRRESTLST